MKPTPDEEQVILVAEDGTPIGTADKRTVHTANTPLFDMPTSSASRPRVTPESPSRLISASPVSSSLFDAFIFDFGTLTAAHDRSCGARWHGRPRSVKRPVLTSRAP